MRALTAALLLLAACARESGAIQADPLDIACAEQCATQGGLITGASCELCDGSRACRCWEGDEDRSDVVCGNVRAWQGCGEWVR